MLIMEINENNIVILFVIEEKQFICTNSILKI